MLKNAPQHVNVQNQPATRQGRGVAVDTPQTEQIAQLEAMIESSPQAEKQGSLAAMMDSSPTLNAQRKFGDMLSSSPRQIAQRQSFDSIHNSPMMVAQHKRYSHLFGTVQRAEDEEPIQGKSAIESPAQLEQKTEEPNKTGLPDNLKSGIENLSGMSMDGVKVHYNSSQPAALNAHAYAQGTDIHVAPGQEQHLPHEAWHVVQQAQGRVQPTKQMKDGVPVNDDTGLEQEADVMGERATANVAQRMGVNGKHPKVSVALPALFGTPVQRAVIPVYLKAPPDAAEQTRDKLEVDQFATNSALGANAGTVRSDFATGGNISNVQAPEKVIVTGHGNVGTLNGYTGSEIAAGLKTAWALPKAYTGDILLSSCKAGDAGWFSSSLVASVSNELFGYQATVQGLKGNVVTGGANSSQPGVKRSVGSDENFAAYKALEQSYRDLVALRDREYSGGAGGLSRSSAQLAELRLFTMKLNLEKARKSGSSVVSSLMNVLSGSLSEVEQITLDMAEVERARAGHQQVAADEWQRVQLKYQARLTAILAQIDAVGIPLGDPTITVSHGPQDRQTLSNLWVDFLMRESEAR